LQNEPNTTIEQKRYTPERADEALTQALRGKKGRLTKADAITVSGLPSYLVDDSLERLLKRYKSRLEVTDEGELLYSFDPALVRRDEPTLAERLRDAGRVLAKVGVWVFKAWITVTLVAYVVVFVALALAMMFGGGDRRRDDDRGFGGGGMGWIWWFLMPDWITGRGYGRTVISPQLGDTAFRDFAPAVFIAAEWGLAGTLARPRRGRQPRCA